MKPLLVVLALALAANASAGDLEDRLAVLGDDLHVAVYEGYPSGRPRLVIAAIRTDEGGAAMLVRLPNNDRGKPAVLDRKPLEDRPVSVTVQRIVDPKDVVVTMTAPHTPGANLYRVRGNELVFIGLASAYGDLGVVDLDHDGIPELITSGCCHPTKCGVMIMVGIMRFNGKMYVDDAGYYIEYAAATPGSPTRDEEFAVDEDPKHARRPFLVHVWRDRGITGARVTIDDELVADGQRIELETGDCHTISVEAHGRKDATVHVFIEQP